jgi:CheY-like chemotaxis protein
MARILVIDDEALVRVEIAAALRGAGHIVTLAEDGRDALTKFLPQCFDLVITDIVMPHMEGIETMRAMRQLDPQIRIIAMSGTGAPDRGFYLKAAVALGADATLQKPICRDELHRVVGETLAVPEAEIAAVWFRQTPDWVSPLNEPDDPSYPYRMPRGLRFRSS